MKKYKKGTKVWLIWGTHDRNSRAIEEYVLESNMSEYQLNELAKEYYFNDKEPHWGFSETNPEDDE